MKHIPAVSIEVAQLRPENEQEQRNSGRTSCDSSERILGHGSGDASEDAAAVSRLVQVDMKNNVS